MKFSFDDLSNHPILATLPQSIRKYSLALIVGGLGAFLVVAGIISQATSPEEEGITFETTQKEEAKIFIDVSGSVLRPGVYELSSNARIQDALIAAGGLAGDADREWVAKAVNLAAKIVDGTKIYIPAKGTVTSASPGQASVAGISNISSLININSATQTELEKLPGIGPVTAQKIITNRPYTDVQELLSKKAVGAKVFDQIKSIVSVY